MLSDRMRNWKGAYFPYREFAEEVSALEESLRAVARAAGTVWEYFEGDYSYPAEVAIMRQALDALPQWVLDNESE